MIPELVRSFESSVKFIQLSVADLSEQEMVAQLTGIPNHATWTLGHIIFSCQEVSAEIGADRWLPDDWEARFGYGSTPLSDQNHYPQKSEMVASLDDAEGRLKQALLATTESVWNQSLPDETYPTMGHILVQIVAAHTAYHVGQLTVWRRAIGKESIGVFI